MLTGRTVKPHLVIEAPPRHGKSELISRYLPAWYLGMNPNNRVILTSYGDALSRGWGRKARELVDEAGGLFGIHVSDVSAAADIWDIAGNDGGMLAAGVGGPITGKGANLLIVDDPVKNAEEAASEVYRDKIWEWWQSTASVRMEPDAHAVVIATRWHSEDLTGRLLNDEAKEWTRLKLPAIADGTHSDTFDRRDGDALWPDRWPLPKLERIKARLDRFWWSSLYQQAPIRPGDCEFPEEYFNGPGFWFERWPHCDLVVIALDPSKGKDAKKGDYSAFVALGISGEQGDLYCEADMARRPTPQIVADGVALCRKFRPDAIGIESNQFQELLADQFDEEFRRQNVLIPTPYKINNTLNKQVRIRKIGPYLAGGRIRFADTPGTRMLIRQLEEFPLGTHDDGPDALEMAIGVMAQMLNTEFIEA